VEEIILFSKFYFAICIVSIFLRVPPPNSIPLLSIIGIEGFPQISGNPWSSGVI
jgi:hypothetical protein